MGRNTPFPLKLRLLGEISTGVREQGHLNFGEKKKIKNMMWGRISSCRELYIIQYTPL